MSAYPPRAAVAGNHVPKERSGVMRGARAYLSPGTGHGHVPTQGPAAGPDQPASAQAWPLRDFIEIGALPGAVPCARYHARQVLWEWQLTALADSAELLVSELVTNAVTACRSTGRGSPVRLWLLAGATRVLILVQDDNPQPPVRIEPGADDERGRGLLLVEAISSRWAWYVPQTVGAGKITWALLETPTTSSPRTSG
jgi:anti-sigma regulatory factor (Ser/Thr protein kinase)